MEYKSRTYALPASPRTNSDNSDKPFNEADGVKTELNREAKIGVGASIVVSSLILAGAWVYTVGLNANRQKAASVALPEQSRASALEEKVLPSKGVVLPVQWGDLGARLTSSGAIDAEKFAAMYRAQNAFTDEYKTLLRGRNDGELTMTKQNVGYLLNLFWALGLANKNPILDSGEMQDPRYGGARNFASTAGWTAAKGNAMDHYSRHAFFNLTPEQQALVDKVSRGIYRPCCGNATHFPDCNHGMAMLGLLELMASQGASEQDMWKTALAVNSYWFPDAYLAIAAYMQQKGVDWKNANPEEVLGFDYSSVQGYARIASQIVQPRRQQGSGGCGVDSGAAIPPERQQQSSCNL